MVIAQPIRVILD